MNNGKISNDTIFLSKYKTVTNKWGKISILKTTSRCGEKPQRTQINGEMRRAVD